MLNPETIINALSVALADSDIEAIHEYCERENRRIVLLKQANARVRASRIRETRASIVAARIVAEKSRDEFERIIRQIAETDNRIPPCICDGALPENV